MPLRGSNWGSAPNPGLGGTVKAGARLKAPAQPKDLSTYRATNNLTLFDFGAARARARPWVLNLKPVGRLGALVPLERCVSCIMRCQDPDMPNRRLPCPTEQRTTSSKRKRYSKCLTHSGPFNSAKMATSLLKKMKNR